MTINKDQNAIIGKGTDKTVEIVIYGAQGIGKSFKISKIIMKAIEEASKENGDVGGADMVVVYSTNGPCHTSGYETFEFSAT